MDIYFTIETLAKSCAMGQDRGEKKQETIALNQAIVEVISKLRFLSFDYRALQ